PHVEIQARKGNVPKIQVALPRCHLHAQLQRKSLAETQIPFVSRIAKVNGVRVLGDRDFTDAIGDVIIDARFIVAVRKPEIGIERVRGIAADGKFTRADLQSGVHGPGALEVHGLRGMLCVHVKAMPARIATAMPEKRNQDHHKRQNPDRGDRKSTRLNSSHVAISYAVFCLKKKKETRSTTRPATHQTLNSHTLS